MKVSWKKKVISHSSDTLASLLDRYGEVESVEMGSKGGNATVVFRFESADLEGAVEDHEGENEGLKVIMLGARAGRYEAGRKGSVPVPSAAAKRRGRPMTDGERRRERAKIIARMEAEERGEVYVDEDEGEEGDEEEVRSSGES